MEVTRNLIPAHSPEIALRPAQGHGQKVEIISCDGTACCRLPSALRVREKDIRVGAVPLPQEQCEELGM